MKQDFAKRAQQRGSYFPTVRSPEGFLSFLGRFGVVLDYDQCELFPVEIDEIKLEKWKVEKEMIFQHGFHWLYAGDSIHLE